MGQTRTPEGTGETHQPLPGLDPGLDAGLTPDDATAVSLATGFPSALTSDLLATAAELKAATDLAHAAEVDLELSQALDSVSDALATIGIFKATVREDAGKLLQSKGFTSEGLTLHNVVIDGLDDYPRVALTPEACSVTLNFSTEPHILRQLDFSTAQTSVPEVGGLLAPAVARLRALGCTITVKDDSAASDDHLVSCTGIQVVIPLRVLFDSRSYIKAVTAPSSAPEVSEGSGGSGLPRAVDAGGTPSASAKVTAAAVQEALGSGVGC